MYFCLEKMELDKEQIKTDLQRVLSRKKPDEDKLDLFVDELIDGINTGWKNVYAPISEEKLKVMKEQIPPELFEKFESMGQKDFNEQLKEIEKIRNENNQVMKEMIAEYLRVFSAFRIYFDQFKSATRADFSGYMDNFQAEFQDTLLIEDVESFLDNSIAALKSDLSEIPDGKRGRKKTEDKFLFVRYVYVFSHCLLGIKGTVSNSNTRFNKVLRQCYKAIGELSEECRHFIRPCFEDYETIYSMAFPYRKHGRLDLYIDHVKETPYYQEIAELFYDYDWNDWEKPHNLQPINKVKN